MEIVISTALAVASLFVSTRVRSELGRLAFVAITLAWACFIVLVHADAIARATIAAGKSASAPFTAGVLRLYENLEPAGICVLLCLAALAVLAVMRRPGATDRAS